jgi:hypothetical protein
MSMIEVKGDLMNCVHESLGNVASNFFLKRALSMIEESSDDKESLWEASCRVSSLTELFIDTDLAKKVREDLWTKIEAGCNGGRLTDRLLPADNP